MKYLTDKRKNLPKTLLPIALFAYLLFSQLSISLSQIFLFAAFLLWVARLVAAKEKPAFPSFFWPLLLYAGLSLLASFFSVNPEISLWDSRELLLFLIVPIVYVAFTSEADFRIASLAFLASGFLNGLYSIAYFLFQAAPGERIAGFMGHYMTQSGLLLLFSCMALSMAFFSRDKLRMLWAVSLVMALFCLALTLTRSSWIGLVVAVSFLLFLFKPKALVVIPVAAGLFFFVSPPHMKKRALSIFSLKGYSNQQRIQYFKAGVQIIGEHPLLGTGPDTVDMVFQNPKYGLSEEAKRNVHLHNNITQIAAERGLPALASWLVFIGWAFLTLLKRLRNRTRSPSLFPLTAAACASILAFFLAGLLEYNFGDSEVVTLFLYMITIPFAAERANRKNWGQSPI